MTSPRKVAANRRNAKKSTGPRSAAGKRRSSGNARRHGLSATSGGVGYTEAEVATLAHDIAGDDANVVVENFAREVAHNQLRLELIAKFKVAVIERTRVLGSPDRAPDPPLRPGPEILLRVHAWAATGLFPKPPDPEATMPRHEPDRANEAIIRALPLLIKLARYERRAIAACLRAGQAMRQAQAIVLGHHDL